MSAPNKERKVSEYMTPEEHLAQRMKSWKFRLWYRWYGLLFKIKMMLGREIK